MLRFISDAGYCRAAALKVCAFAVPAGEKQGCEGFVRAGGLKALFPSFMGIGTGHTRKLHGARAARDEVEHAATLLAALLTWLPRPAIGSGGAPLPGAGLERARVLGKFCEAGGEKAQRLVELRGALATRVAAAAAREAGGGGRRTQWRRMRSCGG